jgi:hypothetical protein
VLAAGGLFKRNRRSIIKAGDIHGTSYCTVRDPDHGRLYRHRWRPDKYQTERRSISWVKIKNLEYT